MSGGGSPPPAPNPKKVIAQQQASNVATAEATQGMNSTNQVTPFSSLNYSQDPTSGQWTATQSLSPTEQGIYDQNSAIRGNMGAAGTALSSQLPTSPVDLSNEAVEKRLFELAMQRIEPQMARDLNSRETVLMNRGIMPGSEAYARELQRFDQSRNDMYNQLALTGRQQSVAEILAGRNQGINEISALLNGAQVANPGFVNTPQVQVQPTDVAGIQQQGYQNSLIPWQQQQAQQNAMMGGLFGLGGTALGGWARGGFPTPNFG
jgi:hypothetical protein